MRRFFVPPEWIEEGQASIRGEVAHRITQVLRMSQGDRVVLLDGTGSEYLVRLDEFGKHTVAGTVLAVSQGSNEPSIRITLCQGILKADKLEWVLQKGTELGVSAFIPLVCQRSIPRFKSTKGSQRMLRWGRIITEAAEQCGRSRVPDLSPPLEFRSACRSVDGASLALIPWEGARDASLKEALKGHNTLQVYLFIGPEGGFQEEEVEYAQGLGIIPVSLGKRILRAETAGLVAATAVLYEAGDLEG